MNKIILYAVAGLACLGVYKVCDRNKNIRIHTEQEVPENNIVIVESKEIKFEYSLFHSRYVSEPVIYTDKGDYVFADIGGLGVYTQMDQHCKYKIWTRNSTGLTGNYQGVITKIEKVVE